MFELSVTAEFCAAHAIVIAGAREALHGHNFKVTAVIAGPDLDREGLLCDFHVVERELGGIIGRYSNKTLNDAKPFDKMNPSAENLARVIAEELSLRLGSALAGRASVRSVSVTEAPGCIATYLSE